MLYHKPTTAVLIREERREKLFNMGCSFSSDHRILSWGIDTDQVVDLPGGRLAWGLCFNQADNRPELF